MTIEFILKIGELRPSGIKGSVQGHEFGRHQRLGLGQLSGTLPCPTSASLSAALSFSLPWRFLSTLPGPAGKGVPDVEGIGLSLRNSTCTCWGQTKLARSTFLWTPQSTRCWRGSLPLWRSCRRRAGEVRPCALGLLFHSVFLALHPDVSLPEMKKYKGEEKGRVLRPGFVPGAGLGI